jgi:hypothetical protein
MTRAALLATSLAAACATRGGSSPSLLPADIRSPIYAVVLDTLNDGWSVIAVPDSTIALTARIDQSLENVPPEFNAAVANLKANYGALQPVPEFSTSRVTLHRLRRSDVEALSKRDGQELQRRFGCKRWPPCAGVVFFSAIGFNSDSTRAVIYAQSWCSPLCGWGELFYFSRTSEREWRVHKSVTLWVS